MQKVLKSYLFWTYPRGSFHYDVMVTLILVFIFFSPRVINYRDRPQEALASASKVLVTREGANELIFHIGADKLEDAADNTKLRQQLLSRVEAISGQVQIDRYSAQRDARGRVTEYLVWAHR